MIETSPRIYSRPIRMHFGAMLGILCLASFPASAVQITINTPFMNLENRAENSLGFGVGKFMRFGANSVIPNGNAGTTGVAVRNSDGLSRNLFFAPFPLAPNWFDRYLVDNAAYRGDWTLRFANGSDIATAAVSLSPTASQAPFVRSITLSGTSAAPTFSWTPPPGALVNAYRVNIYDK